MPGKKKKKSAKIRVKAKRARKRYFIKSGSTRTSNKKRNPPVNLGKRATNSG